MKLTLKDQLTSGEYPVPSSGISFVGRSQANQVVIPQCPGSLNVSGVHCTITASPKEDYVNYSIMDQGSRNGTFLRGDPITGDTGASILNGDEITLGDYRLIAEIK